MTVGIFLRDTLDQTPDSPPATTWNQSPDIIINGTQSTNPTTFTSKYNQAFGNTLYADQVNYIYVRGKNIANGLEKARIWLYHVETDLSLYPESWLRGDFTVAGERRNYVDVTAQSNGEIIDTITPFLWRPSQLPNNKQYALIAIAKEGTNPPRLPDEDFESYEALAKFVTSKSNVAWLTANLVVQPVPTWQQTVPITVNEAGTYQVGVKIHLMPADGHFGISVPGPDADNSVYYAMLPIPSLPDRDSNFTVPVTWPAGFSSSMTISYYQGATPPPDGASLTAIFYPES